MHRNIKGFQLRKTPRLRLEELEPRLVLSAPSSAPSLGDPPPPSDTVFWVNTESALQKAVNNLQSGDTIVVQKGTYTLSNTLYIGKNAPISNVTIRGETDNFDDVTLQGAGMDNANYGNVPMGISVYNAQNVTIADLAIGGVYYHPIELKGDQGCSDVTVYHVHLFDAGEQFVKADPNPSGVGVSNSKVEYCLLEYLNGPPTTDHGGGVGYTNGVDVHDGTNWLIANNEFKNFHTPDSDTSNLWNPAVLIWNHSSNNTVEGNTFINVDRAIAFGLYVNTPGHDNTGGTIVNNFVYYDPGLYSAWRTSGSDGAILAWDSPGTTIYDNTILTNGNLNNSIQVRFSSTTNIDIRNNLMDASIKARDDATFQDVGNYTGAAAALFVNPSAGDLHLLNNDLTQANVLGKDDPISGVTIDWDGDPRPTSGKVDIGADEYESSTPPTVTSKTPTDGATGVATNTTVTATFNESVVASSIVFTLADSNGNSVNATVSYDDTTHTATLTPASLLANSMTYTATMSGAKDQNGNTMPSPVSWSFTTAAAGSTWTQKTVSDFNAGTQSGTSVTNAPTVGVQLAPAFFDDFSGTDLNSSWTTNDWSAQGGGTYSLTVANSIVSVAGGAVTSTATYTNSVIEANLNFGAASGQDFGLATDLSTVDGSNWALFSTFGTNDTLYARVNSNGTTTDVSLGALPTGFHVYTIVPITTGFQFLVDGTLQTTINATFPSGTQANIVLSSFTDTALQADWVRVASYPSSGTFTSSVFDSGKSGTAWGLANWTANLPAGTTLTIQTRSGDTATPDSTWSDWAAVTNGGTVASPSSRYLQYRIVLTTSDPTLTPTLFSISFNWT
jgi:hypothetical protein